MQFIRKKLTCLGNISDRKTVLASLLSKKFSPVISGGHDRFVEILGKGNLEEALDGDIIITPAGEMLYYHFLPQDNALFVGGVWDEKNGENAWKEYAAIVDEAIPQAEYEDVPVISPYFELLREDSEPLPVGEWERSAAYCLRSPGVRQILKVVSERGVVSLPEAAQGRSIFEVGEDVKTMADMGIINCEFEVFCKETGQKVSRVSSLAALDEAAKRGFRCFHCGKAISDEQIVQSLSVCPKGSVLARSNMWLAYTVGAALLDCGVKSEHILFRSENNYHSCEVFADYKGLLLMFSISEQGLDANSVFRILTRSRFFHPDCTFAVTSGLISAEAYKVIEAEGERMLIVSDIDTLQKSIESVADRACRSAISSFLANIDELTKVSVGKIIGEYFLNTPSTELAGAAVALEPRTSASKKTAAESEVVAPVAEIAAESEVAAPVVETIAEPEVIAPVTETAVEPEIAASVAETAVEPEVAAPVAETAVEPEVAAPAAEAAATASDNDVSPDLPAFLPAVSESLNAAVSQLLEHLIEESEDTDNLEVSLNSISDLGISSAMIVADDGMPFLGAMETFSDAESAAAFLPEFIGNIKTIASEVSLGEVQRTFIAAGKAGCFDLYPTADGLTLSVHNIETGSLCYGGRLAKDDTLKKSLMGLTVIDSFFDAVIVTDDVVVDSTTQDCDDIAMAMSKMYDAALLYLDELGLDKCLALVVDTDSQMLAVYPLKEDYRIICILDKGANESVWRKSIPAKLARVIGALDL
ncbi:MAG: hypothetical protein ACI376_06500 [Candidatus Bruticola sp.]